ncbi:MAG: zinc transporter ZupT [Christensenellales bacterium]|jgi:ZIP family zinc transporter
MENFAAAMIVTSIAGLSTGLGGLISLFAKPDNQRIMPLGLGFSTGVMVYLSMVELLPESFELLQGAAGWMPGGIAAVLSFFAGMTMIALLNHLIPDERTLMRRMIRRSKDGRADRRRARTLRLGIVTALAVFAHNMPEGIASFVSAVKDLETGVAVALAIALHNIPEGVAVATPVYVATGSRSRAIGMAFLSGVGEPLGALLAMLILGPLLNDTVFGAVLGAVAGIMVYISFSELFPGALEQRRPVTSIFGVALGIAVMAFGLLLM